MVHVRVWSTLVFGLLAGGGFPESHLQQSAISGTVVNSITSEAIPDAVVTLRSSGDRAGRVVTTDQRGRFVFSALSPSTYSLTASKQGYSSVDSASTGSEFLLAPSQWFQSAVLRLEPQARISGAVFAEGGSSRPGVTVRALVLVWVAGRPQWVLGPTTRSDDEGIYAFDSLRPANYIIGVPYRADSTTRNWEAVKRLLAKRSGLEADGRPDLSWNLHGMDRYIPSEALATAPFPTDRMDYQQVYYPSSNGISAAEIIELKAGDDVSAVNFNLVPTATYHVRGRLLGPAASFPTLTARLVPADFEGLGVGAEVGTSRVTQRGEFVFAGVPPGTYKVNVGEKLGQIILDTGVPELTRNSVLPTSLTSIGSFPPGAYLSVHNPENRPTYTATAIVQVGGGAEPLTDIVMQLVSSAIVTGKVSCDCQRWPNALSLTLDPADGDPSKTVSSIEVASSGVFEFQGVVSGEYHIRVISAERGYRKGGVSIRGEDFTFRPIKVTESSTSERIDVLINDTPAALSGRLVNPVGAAASAATTVYLFPDESEAWDRFGTNPDSLSSTRVKHNGTFELRGGPPGPYFVVAVAGTEAPFSKRLFQELALVAKRVVLTPGSVINITLSAVALPASGRQ